MVERRYRFDCDPHKKERRGLGAGRGHSTRFVRDAVLCIVLACLLLTETTRAEDPKPSDCEPRAIDFDAGEKQLTSAERVALMEAAFYESLARFDECQTTAHGDAGAGGGGVESVAATDIRGPEVEESDEGPKAETRDRQSNNDIEAAVVGVDKRDTIENGKIPEDIPDGDNDSVLEAQIRLAAIRETDPAIQARLWNQYRQYKGLPVKDEDDETKISE